MQILDLTTCSLLHKTVLSTGKCASFQLHSTKHQPSAVLDIRSLPVPSGVSGVSGRSEMLKPCCPPAASPAFAPPPALPPPPPPPPGCGFNSVRPSAGAAKMFAPLRGSQSASGHSLMEASAPAEASSPADRQARHTPRPPWPCSSASCAPSSSRHNLRCGTQYVFSSVRFSYANFSGCRQLRQLGTVCHPQQAAVETSP